MELVIVFVVFVLAMVGLTRPYIGLLALLIVMELQPGELYPQLAPLPSGESRCGSAADRFLSSRAEMAFPYADKVVPRILRRHDLVGSVGILAGQRSRHLLLGTGKSWFSSSLWRLF